jgi:hypothetical protein
MGLRRLCGQHGSPLFDQLIAQINLQMHGGHSAGIQAKNPQKVPDNWKNNNG